MALEQEMAVYEREKPRLLAEGAEGKHILIKGETIEGVFDTLEEGLTAGYRKFGLETSFFLHEIRADEPIAMFTPFYPRCPT